jgi:tetratricopeptide (TPR) repeat protein
MIKQQWIWLIAVLIILSACSSIPRKPISEANQKTRQFLEQARREELKKNLKDALSLYTEAEHNAILANDIDLQLISLQGTARIAYLYSDSVRFNSTLGTMQELVQNVRPTLQYRMVQIKYWKDFNSANYPEVLATTPELSKLPLNVRIEILSYIVQAKAKLNLVSVSEQAQLKNAIKNYHIRLKRKMTLQPELISNAYYSLAYANASASNYSGALSYLNKSISLDRDYDLYVQLADDYVLAGKCEKNRNNFVKARAHLTIALQIYTETNQAEEIAAIKSLLDDASFKR